MQVAQMISIHNTANCQVTHCVVMKQIVECSSLQEGSHNQQVPRVRVHRGAHHCHNVGMPQPKSYQCFLDHLHRMASHYLHPEHPNSLPSTPTTQWAAVTRELSTWFWMIMGCQCRSTRSKKCCAAMPPMLARYHYDVAQDTHLHG